MQKDPQGNPAPAGGFQQGGWYSGYQYWNGSFAPKAGMIHSSSNQQGAGQMVSPEVNRQTSVQAGLAPNANQDYIDRLNAQPVTNPGASAGASASVAGGGGTGGGAGIGYQTQAPINLPDIYKNLYASSGISDLEKQLSDRTAEYTETKGKINDNPFLSEATRVGRIAKIEELFNERTANLRNDIATKKADIETQLNLQTKQFDINSQFARDALDQFNTLLSMGALEGASGEDIANITRSTGISSSAIYSAINAQKKKNVQTQVITSTADDGTVTAVVINSDTGEIISKNNLGQIGNKQTVKEGDEFASTQKVRSQASQLFEINKNSYGHVSPTVWNQILTAYIQSGGTAEDFRSNFSGYANPHATDYDKYGLEY
jgi:hypothetical protein